jgi:hypothetical protein
LLAHWSAAVHAMPSCPRGTHVACLQYAVAVQLESTVQLVGHDPLVHA